MSNNPRVEWLADGRNVRLLKQVEFIDSHGRLWFAPPGAAVNGASIPWLFRKLIGCPFVGKYRSASILHDFHCDARYRPSHEVHRMFYEKMLADETPRLQAWLMYTAVRLFGPRF